MTCIKTLVSTISKDGVAMEISRSVMSGRKEAWREGEDLIIVPELSLLPETLVGVLVISSLVTKKLKNINSFQNQGTLS